MSGECGEYVPHEWRWVNGFWIECNCGWTTFSAFFDTFPEMRANRHVERATKRDLDAAAITALRNSRVGRTRHER